MLNKIFDNQGASKKRKRKGRGIGSGYGKTCGRGHKGQKSRSGVSINGYEGGQTPIYRRLPKRGFSGGRVQVDEVNLLTIETAINKGKIDPNMAITDDYLYECGVVSKKTKFIKILGQGELTYKLNFCVAMASKSAVKKILDKGGSITLYMKHEIENKNKYIGSSILNIANDKNFIFNNSMNYKIQSRIKKDKVDLYILFNISSEDLKDGDVKKLVAVIDCPTAGLTGKVLKLGEDLGVTEKDICEYRFTSRKSNELIPTDSKYNKLDVLLLYDSRFIYRKRIDISKPAYRA